MIKGLGFRVRGKGFGAAGCGLRVPVVSLSFRV
jgi:hypothetical protein